MNMEYLEAENTVSVLWIEEVWNSQKQIQGSHEIYWRSVENNFHDPNVCGVISVDSSILVAECVMSHFGLGSYAMIKS